MKKPKFDLSSLLFSLTFCCALTPCYWAAHAQTAPSASTASPSSSVTPQSSAPPAATDTPAASDALPDAPSTVVHDVAPPTPTGPTVVIDTTMGRLTCKLFDKEAPQTVANFVGLANGTKTWTDPVTLKKMTGVPFYDGTTFHRVIPGFMIQGGDRLGTGEGDAGFYIPDEITPTLRFDVPGRLAMANSGPGTDGSQFFITQTAVPQLNGNYTIFGQCDPHTVLIVTGITLVQRNENDKPLTPVVMNKVTIVPDGQPMPPEPGSTQSAQKAGTPPQ
jgi:peptidyl-prolyl cis-trans isomerase A (cyclophilin A)